MLSRAFDCAPLPGDLWVPPGASSHASLLGLRLLTPLVSQVEVRHQASRPFILTLLYLSAEPGIFVLLLTLAFRQYIKIHRLILSLLLLFCRFERLGP